MNEKKGVRLPPRRIQNIFVLLLLVIFAICCILMTVLGARIYRSTVDDSTRNNRNRVLAAIVRGAARSEDSGIARIERFEEYGVTSLTFVNDYDGDIYYRRLFCYDGYLRESFAPAEYEFEPEMGDTLFEASLFEPALDGSLLTARIADGQGAEQEVYVYLRAGGADS